MGKFLPMSKSASASQSLLPFYIYMDVNFSHADIAPILYPLPNYRNIPKRTNNYLSLCIIRHKAAAFVLLFKLQHIHMKKSYNLLNNILKKRFTNVVFCDIIISGVKYTHRIVFKFFIIQRRLSWKTRFW